ncbi:MAG: flavodoxin family protein [Thermodesulfobacteriota bacterium]
MTEKKKAAKVLVFLGSPRKKGNSAALAGALVTGARQAGAKVETVYLNGLKIKPCQACYACRKKPAKQCVQKDDMQSLYPKIDEADALVFASPVYWFSVSAQTKLVMDRFFAYGARDYQGLAGKRAAVLMSYGDDDPFASGCVNALRSFQDAFNYVGIKIAGMVYGSGEEPGEITGNQALMKKAEELGKSLAASTE